MSAGSNGFTANHAAVNNDQNNMWPRKIYPDVSFFDFNNFTPFFQWRIRLGLGVTSRGMIYRFTMALLMRM
jgi:hypothetical protein